MAEFDAYELYMLTLVNRARVDPAAAAAAFGIDLNQGLNPGTISATPKQPLAPNDILAAAAEGHSNWMLATDTFSHTGNGGSDPGQRMDAAGYDFIRPYTWGENIAWSGTTGTIRTSQLAGYIEQQHRGLFLSPGHRVNILGDSYREIGISQQIGEFSGYNASMITQNFAATGQARFATGVVFNDLNGDGFYNPGEGVGGVSITVNGNAAGQTTAAGGYAIPMTNGTWTMGFSGAGLNGAYYQTVTMSGLNVGLDARSAQFAPVAFQAWNAAKNAFVPVTPEAYSGPVSHLDWQLFGTEGADNMAGSAQDDFINLMGGNDAANGGAGNDVLDGGTGSNFLIGGEGQDIFFADGRGGQVAWTTLVDYVKGEQLSIWGWQPGTSRMTWTAMDGTAGYRGATLHADMNGDGRIDISVTFAGHTMETLGVPEERDGLLLLI
ncbi:CAP domain-containing protein [Niveispirillum sp. KHB5.9]|uniref:CAP domain-containing protein n=1 Tax=Niveispirillum sp. KHB5.9 TaxID=3400269 RepID=UPI003A846912